MLLGFPEDNWSGALFPY